MRSWAGCFPHSDKFSWMDRSQEFPLENSVVCSHGHSNPRQRREQLPSSPLVGWCIFWVKSLAENLMWQSHIQYVVSVVSRSVPGPQVAHNNPQPGSPEADEPPGRTVSWLVLYDPHSLVTFRLPRVPALLPAQPHFHMT